jgi:hypothetical protein
MFWNAPRPEPRKPMVGEHLWSMRKGDKRIDAELCDQGAYGIEVQLWCRGQFLYGRRWASRALAVADADDKRRELEREGWRLV